MKREISNKFQSIFSGIIIITLFLPYTDNILPIEVISSGHNSYPTFLQYLVSKSIDISVLLIIPFFFLSILKKFLNHKTSKIIKLILVLFYLITIGFETFFFLKDHFHNFHIYLIIIIPSLVLFILNFKFSKEIHDILKNIIIAILVIPIISYLALATGFSWYLDYGGYLLNISFFALYFIALYSLLKQNKSEFNERKTKKL